MIVPKRSGVICVRWRVPPTPCGESRRRACPCASHRRGNWTRPLTLRHTGLRDLFDPGAVFSAYSVQRGKPHPDLFLHAAATMRAEPASCLVVEDSPLGVAAAVAAGMHTVAYAPVGNESELLAAGAQTILTSMHKLPELIGLG
jgi:beta-phosphoglucomutase-like phosphatase (HAD superfamily)